MENQTTNYDDQVTTLPDDVLVEVGGASGDGTRSHVIDQGETLNTLAQRFGTTVSRLLKINAELAPSDFTAGRVICAPEVRTT